MTGRDEELAFALAALDEAHAGVVIGGAAGVGKSRLLGEVAQRLEARGDTVVRLVATRASQAIPFSVLAAVLPPPADRHAPGDTPDLLSALREAREALRARAAGRRLVLAVDEGHLLDDETAVLVHQLVAAGQAGVVVALRSGEPVADPVLALWKDGWCARLELQELSPAEVSTLAAEALGGGLEPFTAERLAAVTAGNPLYLRELLHDLDVSGALRAEAAGWTWDGPIHGGNRLAELIAARLGRLDEDERALVDLVAAGEPVPVAVARALVPVDALAALERRGVLTVDAIGDGSVRFGHPLYGEVVRARLPVLGLLQIRARLATAFDGCAGLPADDRLRATSWLLDAGEPLDADRAVESAATALSLGDRRLAERLAMAAREAAASSDEPAALDAAVLLGETLVLDSRPYEAEAVLAPLGALALSDEQRGRRAASRIRGLAYGGRDLEAARDAVADLDLLDEGPWRDYVTAQWATALAMWGRPGEAERLLTPLVDSADPATRFRAFPARNVCLLAAGDVVEATEQALGLLFEALAARERVPRAPAWVGSALVVDLGLRGDLDGAERFVLLGDADPMNRLPANRAFLELIRGRIAVLRGDAASGVAGLELAARLFAGHDDEDWGAVVTAALIEAYALLGRRDEAELAASATRVALVDLAGHVNTHEMARSLAWLPWATGDARAAAAALLEVAASSEAAGFGVFAALAAHDALRLGAGTPAIDILDRLGQTVDGERVGCYVADARARRVDDGAALEAVADRLEALGMRLEAADVVAAASDAYGRAGLGQAATRAANRAGRLAGGCPGVRTPALVGLHAAPDLTPRELAVAQLAAEGLTSREIAERLVVSVRTVDNQLSRVYLKLGIAGRVGLAEALGTAAIGAEAGPD